MTAPNEGFQSGTHAGVHSIDHFALHVPDLVEGRRFFESFGLRVTAEGVGLALRASGSEHCWARLVSGGGRRLAWLALSCHAGDLEPLSERVRASANQAAPHPAAPQDGLWFHDPDDNLIRLAVGPKTTPFERILLPAELPRGIDGRRIAPRSLHSAVYPGRLSHVLMFTTDIDRAIAFYSNVLGLALSDRSGQQVAFMHGRYGSDHHLVAFGRSHAPGWHHSSWDVPSVDDVGRGAAQMEAAGYSLGWGVGRHVLGSNYFYYVRDPWGSFAEYSAEIDFIASATEWNPMDVASEDALHLWGPPVPDTILDNTQTI